MINISKRKGPAGDELELLVLLEGWVLVEVQELELDDQNQSAEHPSTGARLGSIFFNGHNVSENLLNL
jgi:hypothetical protein